MYKTKIGGLDKRREKFKGWVEVEHFAWRGVEGSYCILRRDEVRVIRWKTLELVLKIDEGKPHLVETTVEGSRQITTY